MHNRQKSTSLKNMFPFRFTTLSASLLLALLAFNACKDEPSKIGMEVLPGSDFFAGAADSTQHLEGYNFLKGAVRSDDANYGIIGEFNDPVFGKVKSDFVVQFHPSLLNVDFEPTGLKTYTLKGVYLNFKAEKQAWYGDSTALHKISVYELKEMLPDIKYFSDIDMTGKYDPIAVAEKSVKAMDGYRKIFVDSITAKKDTVKVERGIKWVADTKDSSLWSISIPLDSELAKKLFAINKANTSSVQAFSDYFKGLYITSELENPNKSCIIKTNLMYGSKTNIELRYELSEKTTTTAEPKKTIQSYYFYPYALCRRINRFENQFSSELQLSDSPASLLYIKGLSGIESKITIDTDNLYSDWKEKMSSTSPRYGVSGIDLILEVDATSDTALYAPPAYLMVALKNSLGISKMAPVFKYGTKTEQYIITNLGLVNKSTVPYAAYNAKQNRYHLKLDPNYFEALMHFKANPESAEFAEKGKYAGFTEKNTDGSYKYIYELDELYLSPATQDETLERVILKGPAHPTSPLRLRIKYFTFE
jgi:hypothetical protein